MDQHESRFCSQSPWVHHQAPAIEKETAQDDTVEPPLDKVLADDWLVRTNLIPRAIGKDRQP